MLKREIDLFLGYIRLRQIPKGAGNEMVSRFFCACLAMETINSHNINLKLSLMKKQTKKKGKAVALSLAMAAALSLPLDALGQGLFGEGSDSGGNQGLLGRGPRGTTEGTFTHQTFGNDYDGTFTHQTFGNNHEGNFTHQTFGNGAPVGGGLFILLSAGIGYAATKRKKQNKKNQQNKRNQIN